MKRFIRYNKNSRQHPLNNQTVQIKLAKNKTIGLYDAKLVSCNELKIVIQGVKHRIEDSNAIKLMIVLCCYNE